MYGLHLKWQTAHFIMKPKQRRTSKKAPLPRTLPVTTTRTRPAMDRLTRDYTDPLLTDQPDTSRQSAAVQPRRPFSPLVKRRRHRRRRLLPRPLHHSEHAR